MSNTSTTYDALLQEYYTEDDVANAIFVDRPMLGLMPKKEDVEGKDYVVPIVTSAGQGRSRSATVANTMAGLTAENASQFVVPLVEDFAIAKIGTKLLAQTKTSKKAWFKATTLVADNQLKNLANNLAVGCYGTHDGMRGRIGTIQTNGTVANSQIVLLQPKDIYSFAVGMQLDVAAAQSSGAVRAYGSNAHGLYIVNINYSAGTFDVGLLPTPGSTAIAVTDAADGIPTAVVNDYLYVTGDRNAGVYGFNDWIPYGGPSATAFFGVVRTSNATFLAGNYLDGTNGSLLSVLETAAANVGEIGGELTHFMMPWKAFRNLSLELGSKTQLVDMKINATVGYRGIQIVGQKGLITCLPDRNCPANTIAGMNMDTWELASVGKAVRVWDEDGKIWLRAATFADGMEIRFHGFNQPVCHDPRQNINIRITP